MKTLLIGLNAKYIHTAPAVYSLSAYAGRYLDDPCEVLEYTINQSYDEIYYTIAERRPDVAALSVYIWNVTFVGRLLHDLRRAFPECRLIIGGPEVSYGLPAAIAEEDYDFLIAGEGERAFTALLCELSAAPYPAEWGFAREGKICTAAPIGNLDELPFFYEGQMDRFRHRILYYEASRGCPYHCTYCLSAAEEGLRLKSADRVLAELSYLVDHGAALVKFLDRSFNARPETALAILSYIAQIPADNPIRFHFEIEADTLTEELLAAFERMPRGRVQLEIGIQSTNPDTLRAVRRNPSVERLFANVRRLLAAGNLKVHTDLIAGLPYEDLAAFAKSFSEAYALGAHELQLGFLKRLTGAPLAAEEGWHNRYSTVPPYEILENDFLSVADLARLKRVEDALDRFGNSGRFTDFFAALLLKFADAWTMFSALADFLADRGLGYQALGAMEEFGLLADFAGDDDALLTALLCDFYAYTSSDALPRGLSRIADRPGDATEQSLGLLRECGQRDRKLVCRFIGGKPVLYDYTGKDPVTERYGVLNER